jgi:hypothetical protein
VNGVLEPLVYTFGAVLALGVLALCLLVLRRYLLTRPIGSFDCSMRRETGHSAGGWILGVARYEEDRLDWFRVFTMSPRPGRSLSRPRLLILDRREPQHAETYAVTPGAVIVRCAHGASTLEFAMSEQAADGLATWLESAPPGQHTIA